jgi:hypothetical protein
MRSLFTFVAALVGAALSLRGVADWGLGILCAAAALVAFHARFSPLLRVEAALAVAAALTGAVRGHEVEGVCGAAVAVLAIVLLRIM